MNFMLHSMTCHSNQHQSKRLVCLSRLSIKLSHSFTFCDHKDRQSLHYSLVDHQLYYKEVLMVEDFCLNMLMMTGMFLVICWMFVRFLVGLASLSRCLLYDCCWWILCFQVWQFLGGIKRIIINFGICATFREGSGQFKLKSWGRKSKLDTNHVDFVIN